MTARYTTPRVDPATELVSNLRARMERRRIMRQIVMWLFISVLGCMTGFAIAMVLEMAAR